MEEQKVSSKERPAEPSGIVSLEGDKVTWHNEDVVFMTLDLRDVVVIGEYTTPAGHWFDDWFLVFVLKDGSWHKVSYYAENIDKLTGYLGKKFDAGLAISELVDSTSWKSLVTYPAHLRGKPLFKLVPSKENHLPKNAIQRFLHGLGLGGFNSSKEIELSEEVKGELVRQL